MLNPPTEFSKEARSDYRVVLFEWNERIKQFVASAEIEFGVAVRDSLEFEIWPELRAVGASLEEIYRGPKAGQTGKLQAATRQDLDVGWMQ